MSGSWKSLRGLPGLILLEWTLDYKEVLDVTIQLQWAGLSVLSLLRELMLLSC
jgi:hypothetical protein